MPDQSSGPVQAAAASTAAEALTTVANLLTEANFNLDILGDACLLKISNARGALCELTITTAGAITWEYRPYAGRHADPARLIGLVLNLLDPHAPHDELPVPRRNDLTLKGIAGRALADHGMHVTFHVLDIDDYFFDTYAEIHITSPANPERGTARLSDDGAIWWHCHTHCTATSTAGLTLPEIAAAIARALMGAGHLPCHA
jgi:hypothetical protein